jgi:hypothetical protein
MPDWGESPRRSEPVAALRSGLATHPGRTGGAQAPLGTENIMVFPRRFLRLGKRGHCPSRLAPLASIVPGSALDNTLSTPSRQVIRSEVP